MLWATGFEPANFRVRNRMLNEAEQRPEAYPIDVAGAVQLIPRSRTKCSTRLCHVASVGSDRM